MSSLLSSDKNLSFDGRATPLKSLLFVLVCTGWLYPGLTGHTPWKYDEAVSQGIVHGLLHTGHWLTPELAGEPYLGHPPLYYWVAAVLARWFQPWLPAHDGARLASGLFMVLTFVGLAQAAQALYGPRSLRSTVLVFIGSIGLVIRAHEASADTAWLAGTSLVLAGIAQSRSNPVRAGLFGGLGFALAALSQGLLAFPLLLPPVVLAPLLDQSLRPRYPSRYFGLWLLGAGPACAGWPLLQAALDPAGFALWWPLLTYPWHHPASWLVADSEPIYYVGVVSWFAWPAAPLALAGLWNGGLRVISAPPSRLLGLCLALWWLILGFCTAPHESNALPLLLPLALLSAGTIDQLRRGASGALDWFGMITFGLLTSLLWLGWIAQLTGVPSSVVGWLDAQLPGFQAQFSGPELASALGLTLLWLFTILRSRPSPRRAIINWTVSMTVSWMLLMTLWLPYVEAARGYAPLMASLRQALPPAAGCVYSSGLGEPQRGLLDYFLDLRTQRLERHPRARCNLWLVQTIPGQSLRTPPGWLYRWSGSRRGERTERFVLFGR